MLKPPYPGLRPFQTEDHEFFFGQEKNTEALFLRVAQSRFVAVLGESGCGKSSLVNAGLIPQLCPEGGSQPGRWQVIVTHPAMSPIENLMVSLAGAAHLPDSAEVIEGALRSGPAGLTELLSKRPGETSPVNVLLVVDQFEELFRFRREGAKLQREREDDSALYVKLLLHVSQHAEAKTFVVLTMRSEYIGDSAQFYGLSEAISDGLFLLPRMTRSQCEEAILDPLKAINERDRDDPWTIAPALVQRLLNEAQERQDGLPLLQHGLRWLFDQAASEHRRQMVLPKKFEELPRKSEDGEEVDFLSWCLNDHLDEVFDKLKVEERQTVAARMFKMLGEPDSKGRLVRNPTE